MLQKPTVADFQSKLEFIVDDLVHAAGKKGAEVQGGAARQGALGGSRHLLQLLELTRDAVDEAAAMVLGELRSAIEKTELDRVVIRGITGEVLGSLVPRFAAAFRVNRNGGWSGAPRSSATIPAKLQEMNDRVSRHLRHFDVGLYDTAAPEPLNVTNSNVVNATNVYGVQQGTSHSVQNVSVQINVHAAMEAIQLLKSELAGLEERESSVSDVKSDLETIEAQLKKLEPNKGILREAMRSVRNVTEGVIGGLLTPAAVGAIVSLGSALGL